MPPVPVALLVDDHGDEPFVRVLRSRRAVDAAVGAGLLVLGPDGRPVGDVEVPDAPERLARAHAAMAARFGLPAPDLPEVRSQVVTLMHLARLAPLVAPPGTVPDPTAKGGIGCFFCVLNRGLAACPDCRVRNPTPQP